MTDIYFLLFLWMDNVIIEYIILLFPHSLFIKMRRKMLLTCTRKTLTAAHIWKISLEFSLGKFIMATWSFHYFPKHMKKLWSNWWFCSGLLQGVSHLWGVKYSCKLKLIEKYSVKTLLMLKGAKVMWTITFWYQFAWFHRSITCIS